MKSDNNIKIWTWYINGVDGFTLAKTKSDALNKTMNMLKEKWKEEFTNYVFEEESLEDMLYEIERNEDFLINHPDVFIVGY